MASAPNIHSKNQLKRHRLESPSPDTPCLSDSGYCPSPPFKKRKLNSYHFPAAPSADSILTNEFNEINVQSEEAKSITKQILNVHSFTPSIINQLQIAINEQKQNIQRFITQFESFGIPRSELRPKLNAISELTVLETKLFEINEMIQINDIAETNGSNNLEYDSYSDSDSENKYIQNEVPSNIHSVNSKDINQQNDQQLPSKLECISCHKKMLLETAEFYVEYKLCDRCPTLNVTAKPFLCPLCVHHGQRLLSNHNLSAINRLDVNQSLYLKFKRTASDPVECEFNPFSVLFWCQIFCDFNPSSLWISGLCVEFEGV